MTSLKPGMTIIENGGAWAHPDDIDIDLYTFGKDYIHLYIPSESSTVQVNLNKEGFPGGFHIAIPLAEMDEIIQIQGWLDENTPERANLVKKFQGLHRKVNQPLTFIIIKRNDDPTGVYQQFINPRDQMVDFAPGYIGNLNVSIDMEERLYNIRGSFEIAWVVY